MQPTRNPESHSLADLMPTDARLFSGEFSFDGALRFHSARRPYGGIERLDCTLELDAGEASYTMVGSRDIVVDWGSYRFPRDIAYAARIDRPFVELHFQLEGAAHTTGSTGIEGSGRNGGFGVSLRAGETNMVAVPATSGTFGLAQASRGAVFEVLLAKEYMTGLADRHPGLLEHLVEGMHGEQIRVLRRPHLPMSAAMWGIIQRFRDPATNPPGGALFLESQVLELLALQLAQVERPAHANGTKLAARDVERIHAARDLLVARIHDPPTLAELGRFALMNEFKLKRGFREIFGTSPYAYMLGHRLELARTYVRDTDWSIARIARTVGYSDPAHLTHAFRKRFGVRPSDLRTGRP